ncbi:TLC domain-containing protein [Ochromonadaceae sp. CCMP2298]|nr:TLC domain-containing protein [Ochromonadaceae sp. CCMP2298]
MVPTAWVHVYSDSVLTAAEAAVVKYALVEAYVGPFCVGYLMGDTIAFAVPEAFRGRFEYLVHHVLTIWLIITAMFGPGNLCRYIPHLLLCDTTNIFFNSAWLLRRSGWKGTSLVSALEMSFALCFLLVRVINLPLIFLNALMQPCVVQWGAARFTLIPIAGMQWYWFYKIASTIISRLVPNPRKSKSG